ncbi:MAG: adenosine deaminase [Oscillospiraceae bacterium]|nr:adenosine deaminase [Oscillospiraceae bacterium]
MKRIDLHNHLDGSLPVATVLELAEMSGVELPAKTVETLRPYLTVEPDCTSLNEYLEKFAIPVSVLQTEACLEKAVYDTMKDLDDRGVCYAELRFAPGQHLQRGLTQTEVTAAAVRGLNKALAELSIGGQLILCCMRGADAAVNQETIDVTKQFLGKGVCCADLAGAEALFPTSDYRSLFAYAAERGVPYVIHAGEADGPDSMWAAIEMGAKRIGHGIAAVRDEKLMDYLKEHHILLEVCVTSNVQTKGAASYEEHPILRMLEYGIAVTVNTDNMTVSGTDLAREAELIRSRLGMTDVQERQMLENSICAAFLTDEEKADLRNIIFA